MSKNKEKQVNKKKKIDWENALTFIFMFFGLFVSGCIVWVVASWLSGIGLGIGYGMKDYCPEPKPVVEFCSEKWVEKRFSKKYGAQLIEKCIQYREQNK